MMGCEQSARLLVLRSGSRGHRRRSLRGVPAVAESWVRWAGRALALVLAADAVVFVVRQVVGGSWSVRAHALGLCDVALGSGTAAGPELVPRCRADLLRGWPAPAGRLGRCTRVSTWSLSSSWWATWASCWPPCTSSWACGKSPAGAASGCHHRRYAGDRCVLGSPARTTCTWLLRRRTLLCCRCSGRGRGTCSARRASRSSCRCPGRAVPRGRRRAQQDAPVAPR